MVCYMNSKDFLKHYIKKYPERALCSQYVIVSNTIYTTNKYKDIVVNKVLFPSSGLLSNYYYNNNWEEFVISYKSQLRNDRPMLFLSVVLDIAINDDEDIVFICSKEEWKRCPFLKILSDFCMEVFQYPLIDYHRYMTEPYTYDYDIDFTMKKVKKLQDIIRSDEIPTKNSSKKDIKKFLKFHHIEYEKGMSKTELLELVPAPKIMRSIEHDTLMY